MFLTEPNPNELRQGDVIRGLFFPFMKSDSLQILSSVDSTGQIRVAFKDKKYGKQLMQALVGVISDFSIVISQCCDIQVNEGQTLPAAPAFVIAPLFRIPSNIAQDAGKLEKFRNNGKDYANLFSLLIVPPLTDEHAMVDFSRLVSIPVTEYPNAIKGKVLQMTDVDRVRFKTKVAAHFGRPTEEEKGAGLYPTNLD